MRSRLLELACADFPTFYEQILGYNNSGEGMPAHQEKWGEILQEEDLILLLAPACHGKSTLSSVGYATWEVARDRSLRVGIVTNTDDLAQDILTEIKGQMEENETLIEFFGKFKPDKPIKWNKTEIRVEGSGSTMRKKDATITVGGAGASWKGKRFDLLIVDDLVDEKNASTPERAKALIDWFWSTLKLRMEPWGRIKIVGTREKDYDFYSDLIKNPRGFKIVHDKAIVDEKEQKVLWPEKWSYKVLSQMRSDDFVGFMKHFQNIVVSGEVAKLTTEQVERCYDYSIKYYTHGIPDEVRKQFKCILTSVDPAWTRGRRAKFSVIKTVGWRHDGRRQVLDVFREQVEYNQLFAWIKTKYNTLRPQYVIVETNQMQVVLERELAQAGIPTIATFTSDRKNHLEMGIPMLYSVVGSGNIVLPCGDEICKNLSKQFINELMSWPDGDFSDVLMAYYFIEQEIRKRSVETVRVINKSVITGQTTARSRFARHYGILR